MSMRPTPVATLFAHLLLGPSDRNTLSKL